MAKVRVHVQYRAKNGTIKTKSKTVKDKAQMALFINKFVKKGTFVGYTQEGL